MFDTQYLLSCKKCAKHTGEIVDNFKLRWNNYKSNDWKFQRKKNCMQEHLFRHFHSEGHEGYVKDVSITLIDKTNAFDLKKRKKYCIRTL